MLESKSSGKSVVDYEEIQQLSGGNFGKMGTSLLGSVVDKAKNFGKGKANELIRMNPTAGVIQDILSKYM